MMFAFALAIAVCAAPPAPRVTCVVDGDTVWIAREKIRLIDIDAPEMNGKCPAERALAIRARDRLIVLLNGREVTIAREGTDRYGRTLARLGDVGEVPVTGEVRRRVEANIARAKAAGRFDLIMDDTRGPGLKQQSGRPTGTAAYSGESGTTRFQRDFAKIRDTAANTAAQQGDEALAEEIRTLQFRDLRRTCVVYLGELGLEDHLIAAITGHDIDETRRILRTYMPRTTGRAARAIALVTAREAKEAAKEKKG